ncbi:MurR/RpiR family transcriptional regulator [[Ruminococcus] torques]|uniref:MurR/RpiR family transcriptional regulator n=1 Tax=[Ruminococcus] torques TaxID=33039 RepID=UPI0025A4829F|nr:MurR/RpiR family transcriptional regulator [[Ruminococcus] torques]MDM8235976.1 MurR/RpiR family transcriptional regulator [[Ruminococcus] torques]
MFTKEMMDTFTDLDLAVYDCIVKNRGRISRMPIKELAAMAHVSTATILRFCRKCGADGYSEFKIKYREHLEGKRDALKDDGTAELQSFVNQAWSEDFQESIEMAFQYLRKSRCTIFIGVGSSGMLGKYGARYFSNVGRFSLFIDDPWLPVLQDLAENTVTIALSESGLTSQTITIASQLQERGSRLISITNNANSVLARMADCNISYHVAEALVNERNVTTQIPVIYIIETLAKKLYNSDNP